MQIEKLPFFSNVQPQVVRNFRLNVVSKDCLHIHLKNFISDFWAMSIQESVGSSKCVKRPRKMKNSSYTHGVPLYTDQGLNISISDKIFWNFIGSQLHSITSRKFWGDIATLCPIKALLRTVNSTWFFPHHMVFYWCVFAVTWSNIVLNLVYHKEYYVQLSTPHSVLCSVLYYYRLQTWNQTWCILS